MQGLGHGLAAFVLLREGAAAVAALRAPGALHPMVPALAGRRGLGDGVLLRLSGRHRVTSARSSGFWGPRWSESVRAAA